MRAWGFARPARGSGSQRVEERETAGMISRLAGLFQAPLPDETSAKPGFKW
jgi:hypothetical protein